MIDSIYYKTKYPYYNEDLTFEKIVPKNNNNEVTKINVSGQWLINDGWEVEIISPKKIAIKKFKIDTWGLRFITFNTSNNFNNRCFKVTGISWVNDNVILFLKAFAGSSGYNVYWYPGQFTSGAYCQGLVVQKCIGYVANDNEREDSLQMGKHPWDVYRSCISDGIIQSTWGDDSYRGICIGLYGGEQIATKWHDEVAYKVYDISEHPIIIDLHVLNTDAVVDIGNIECWDAYLSDLKIYHKDKTADNYWRKYGLISKPSPTLETFIVEHRIGLQDILSRKYNISPITDFDNFMDLYNNSLEYVSWVFCRPANIDFWDPIKEYYKTHIISWKELSAYGNFGYGIFSSCTLDKLELNFGNIDGDIFMAAHLLIAFSTITELTINVDSNCRVSSLNSLCRNSNIEHLYWKGTSPIVHDLSHLFEGAPNIKTIPDCIKWNETLTGTANLTTSFMGCSKLSRIDCLKGMVCIAGTMPHTFDGCTSITYIEPIFDVSRISPETYGGYNIFKGCTKLYHLKLKGIHGIWRMDGSTHPARLDTWPANSPHTNGDLLSLDTECIKHLFDNALAAKLDEICLLYCPQEWSDKITENMLTSIKSKGWEIYVGNVLL